MQPSDRKAFVAVVMGFAELKGKTLSAAALELYWRSMQHWTLADFQRAAEHLLRTSEFMPTPGDFEKLRQAGEPSAAEVFADLRQWLEYSPNGYRLRQETPRRIAVAIGAMGGAQAYAMADEDKLPFLERRFCEHYERLTESHEARVAIPGLLANERELAPLIQHHAMAGTFKSFGTGLPTKPTTPAKPPKVPA